MSDYSTNWLTAIFASIVFHVAAVFGFFYIMPHFNSAPKIQPVAEIEWIDVDISDDAIIADTEENFSDSQETLPTFDAQDLIVPEIKFPEPKIENPLPEIKPVEPPKPKPPPQISENKPDVKPKENPPANQPETSSGQQIMGKPPVVAKEVYPEKGSGLGYKGYVSIAARIGKDGKVKSTEIIQSSGRYFVDEIAVKAAAQWTYKPALDQTGRPMECDTIITFNFKKLNA